MCNYTDKRKLKTLRVHLRPKRTSLNVSSSNYLFVCLGVYVCVSARPIVICKYSQILRSTWFVLACDFFNDVVSAIGEENGTQAGNFLK